MTCLFEIMPTINVRTTFTVLSIISRTLFSFIQLCYIGKAAKYNVAKLNVANLRETRRVAMRKHMLLLTLSFRLYFHHVRVHLHASIHTHTFTSACLHAHPNTHMCDQTQVFFWEGQRSKLSSIPLQGSVCVRGCTTNPGALQKGR